MCFDASCPVVVDGLPQPALLGGGSHVIHEVPRRARPRALGVRKQERLFVRCCLQEVPCSAVFGFGFAAEACDDVCGDADVRDDATRSMKQGIVAVAGVTAPHSGQNSCTAYD